MAHADTRAPDLVLRDARLDIAHASLLPSLVASPYPRVGFLVLERAATSAKRYTLQ